MSATIEAGDDRNGIVLPILLLVSVSIFEIGRRIRPRRCLRTRRAKARGWR
jgi:hypothetical protein